jgi:hypothetical protein
MGLKELHYQSCREEGLTDEEIATDWKLVEKEIESFVVEGVPEEEELK